MGRLSLWVLLGLTLFAVSLHDVQVSADVGPTESECRPYIEKAIHELQTGEVHEPDASKAASQEDSGGDATSLEDESSVEGVVETADEISAEQPAEETEPSEEAEQSAEEATPSEEAAEEEPPSEEAAVGEESAAVEEEPSQEEAASVETEAKSEEAQEEPQQDEAVSEEGDSGSVAAEEEQSAEVEGEAKEAASVEEQSETQTEEDQTTEAQSTEEEPQPEESAEGEASAEVEGGSEAEPSAEAESELSAEAEGEPSPETEAEQSAEVQGEQSAEVEGEAAVEGEVEQSAETETEQSVETDEGQSAEAEEPSAEAESEPSAETEAEPSAEAEDEQSAEIEGEAVASAEAESEPSAEDEAESEVSAEAGEEKSAETESEAAQEQSTEAEQSAEAEGEASVEEGEEQAPASEEAAPSEEEEEAVVKSRGRRSVDESESAEGEAAPQESAEAETEKTEAESTEEVSEGQEGEEAAEEGASTESGEKASETHPEDDLLLEFEIPDNLRDRKHINELLHLDEEFEAKEKAIDNVASVILRDLKRIYENAVKPLEALYKYRDLSNRHFADPEIFSKPLVLFMGPWSGGKSTIINYLTGNEYNINSLRTGADPSPAYFNILMYGNETEVLDGTQLAADYTFSGLQKFGQGLQDRLYGLKLPNKLLEKVNIVEIPGILEVRKQVSRLFPFNDACQWFIDRADIIFLVYDPAKLDVGPETEAILDQLKGREYQTRIVLNKADQVKPEELLRVQSALIWNISPSMSSAQPPTMYTASLWSHPYETSSPVRLLQAQERALLRDIRTAIDKRIEHKIASARRFAVRVRNHAKMVDCYLTTYYNHKTLFGNKKRISDDIIDHPQNYHIYEGLSTLTNISRYDLPDPEVYRDFFRLNPLYDFQKLSETCTYFRGCPINKLDIAIAYDLPELGGKYKKLVETALTSLESSTDSETSKS